MIKLIEEYREKKDSLGGLVEVFVLGMPVGVGEPFLILLSLLLLREFFPYLQLRDLNLERALILQK